MVTIVQILGLLHAVAMIVYVAGDSLAEIFSDEDGDGVPNAFDRDYKRKPQQMRQAFTSEERRAELAEPHSPNPRGGEKQSPRS